MAGKGLLVVFSGPSGAGKGTVLRALRKQNPGIRLSVSATTRAPRPGETDGREYYFMTREKFKRMAENGGMLEFAEYCGNCYGTPAAPIERWTSEGTDVILEIEVQGGAQVQRKRPDVVSIFILPPSLAELRRRLKKRGTEPAGVVRSRLETARKEIAQAGRYDYVVVNDSVEEAAARVGAILRAEKCRTCRNEQLMEGMLQHD